MQLKEEQQSQEGAAEQSANGDTADANKKPGELPLTSLNAFENCRSISLDLIPDNQTLQLRDEQTPLACHITVRFSIELPVTVPIVIASAIIQQLEKASSSDA